MDKHAESAYPLHDLVANRWSPLAFSERIVSEGDLKILFEAARWAPSCYNDQPWHFIYAHRAQQEAFDRILGCLAETNQLWASRAAVLVISVTRTSFSANGKPNAWAWHDVGLAVGNLLTQATAMGIYVHQMGGFDRAKAKDTLGVPDGHEAVTAFAIGYPGDPEILPEALRARELAPRQRKPQDQFVFPGTWGGA